LFLAALLLLPLRLVAAAPNELANATIVVYNETVPEGKILASYYAGKRAIPQDHIVALKCTKEEVISRSEYDSQIVEPLRSAFDQHHWWTTETSAGQTQVTNNSIRFVALIFGIPLKISPTSNYPGDHPDSSKPFGSTNEAAVDSELATLGFFTRQISGPIPNPYYRGQTPIILPGYLPQLLLVTRLDGPTITDVRRMIDDGLRAEKRGLWGWTYIDTRSIKDPKYVIGDNWLLSVANQSFANGRPAIVDRFATLFPSGYPLTNAATYFGWYAENCVGALNDPGFKFLPGAIGVHIHSFSARTIHNPTANWVGPMIVHGITATLGNVSEPYLPLTPQLDILHDRLLSGMTFAESAYSSLLGISWMTTCVGDPLYRPFSTDTVKSNPDNNPFVTFYQLSLKYHTDPDVFVQNLQRQGATNGLFFEFAGLVEERAGENENALTDFKRAQKTPNQHSDHFRALLDELALLHQLGRKDDLRNEIKREQVNYPEPKFQEVLQFYNSL
jgi:uncharacterized protein (TIGR03790 family)